jgi:peptide/nickel transport system substrate-binding protein
VSQLTRARARRRVAALGCAVALVLVNLGDLSPAIATEVTPTPGASAPTVPRGERSFVVGMKQPVDSFNPYVGVVQQAFEAYGLMYDYLTMSSPQDFSAIPGLAERWDPSPDGRTWTFHLRTGVMWSDGRPLTARDVVHSFQRALDGETENGQYGSYVANITKVTAPDDATVVFTLSEPTPTMLRLAVPIVPEHVWSEIDGDEVATFANTDSPVGSGPFRLVEVQTGQFYRFAANKSYWGGPPKIDELVLRIFADDSAMGQALQKGEIDMAGDISAPVFNSLADVPGVTRSSSKYPGFNELGFNLGAATVDGDPIGDGHPALKDKRVRVAIDHALDRATLVAQVLRGHGSPATGVIPPIYVDQHWSPPGGGRAFDPALANRLLDEAGYPKGTDGVRAGPGGRKLEFRLYGRESSETSKDNVEFIREWLADVGITARVQIMSEDQLTTVLGQGDFDLFEWGWVVEPDPDFQLSVFTCDNRSYLDGGEVSAGWSDSFYCDDTYDALYQRQRTIIDPAERATAVKQAQQMLYDDVAYSMLFYYNTFEAYRSDRFTGLVRQPADGGSFVLQAGGTWTYRNVEPVDPSSLDAERKSEANRVWVILASGAGALLVLAIAVAAVMMRRRRSSGDRE